MTSIKNKKHNYYSNFTTTELEKLLKSDFHSNKTYLSTDDIEIILNIISTRTIKDINQPAFNLENSWDSFINDYLPIAEQNHSIYEDFIDTKEKRSLFPSQLNTRNIAAIFIFLITLSIFSTTTTAKDLFSHIANWSKETFWFADTENTDISISTDIKKYLGLSEIPSGLMPTWLPSNLEKSYEDYIENSSMKYLVLYYEDIFSNEYLNISIIYSSNNLSTVYEKDSTDVIIYSKAGIDYYIMNNIDAVTAIWRNGSFECQITGNISPETLKKIISSISP